MRRIYNQAVGSVRKAEFQQFSDKIEGEHYSSNSYISDLLTILVWFTVSCLFSVYPKSAKMPASIADNHSFHCHWYVKITLNIKKNELNTKTFDKCMVMAGHKWKIAAVNIYFALPTCAIIIWKIVSTQTNLILDLKSKISRSVFRTQSNIYDGAFFAKNSQRLKVVNCFRRKVSS